MATKNLQDRAQRAYWLAGASPALVKTLLTRCDRLTVPAGQVVYRADEPPGGIFAVMSGRVDMHLPRLESDRTLVHVLGPDAWVGDLAAFSGAPRRFELICHVDTHLLRLSRAELQRLSAEAPEIWPLLVLMVTENMRTAIDAAETLWLRDPVDKVASCLARLNRGSPGWDGSIPVTQHELSLMAGLSRRRTIAALQELTAQGCLKQRYGRIVITDVGQLETTRSALETAT